MAVVLSPWQASSKHEILRLMAHTYWNLSETPLKKQNNSFDLADSLRVSGPLGSPLSTLDSLFSRDSMHFMFLNANLHYGFYIWNPKIRRELNKAVIPMIYFKSWCCMLVQFCWGCTHERNRWESALMDFTLCLLIFAYMLGHDFSLEV